MARHHQDTLTNRQCARPTDSRPVALLSSTPQLARTCISILRKNLRLASRRSRWPREKAEVAHSSPEAHRDRGHTQESWRPCNCRHATRLAVPGDSHTCKARRPLLQGPNASLRCDNSHRLTCIDSVRPVPPAHTKQSADNTAVTTLASPAQKTVGSTHLLRLRSDRHESRGSSQAPPNLTATGAVSPWACSASRKSGSPGPPVQDELVMMHPKTNLLARCDVRSVDSTVL